MTETILDDSINDTLPVDLTGNAAYAARFQHQRTLRFGLVALMLLTVVLSVGLVWQSRRPPTVVLDRVDGAGNASAVRYSSLQYTPREAEIRSRLNQWAIYRYRLVKAVAGDAFALNYYYVSRALAQQLMQAEEARVAKILAGNEPEQDVSIDNIQFTALDDRRLPDGAVASGEAVIDLMKTVNPGTQSERQHWTVTLKYEVDPVGAAKRGESDPQFLNFNPLGVTITWFHEDRAFR